MSGVVHLVGAGPGDVDLLTLRAVRLLQRADVVLVDRLVGPRVLEHVAAGAEVIDVGKSPGEDQTAAQERIMQLMIDRARRGATVIRLKGGDPMVFGRGGEELARLRAAGITVDVTPGISSVLAAAASAGFGLTHRGVASAFAVVAGSTVADVEWARYVHVDTLVVLMGVAARVDIAAALIAAGRPTSDPVCFVTSASLAEEERVVATLADVAAGAVEVSGPAVWVIGPVVTAVDSFTALESAG